MVHKEKKSYLLAIRNRYLSANRFNKAKILDEFCEICKYNRKYAIRLLNTELVTKKKKTGPKPTYHEATFMEVLKKIWFTADQPCSKKLKEILTKWLPYYEPPYRLQQNQVQC